MWKTLIFYLPEHRQLAEKLRDDYILHEHGQVDLICETIEVDVEYARRNGYNEAVFIEDPDAVIIHDIKTWYTNSYPISECFYK